MCVVSAVGESVIVSREPADADIRCSLHVRWKYHLRRHHYPIHTQIEEVQDRPEPYLSVPIIQL